MNLYDTAVVFATFVAIIALTRFAFFMVGSAIYDIRHHQRHVKKRGKLPSLSVIIPAYNEENTIAHCVQSIVNAQYDVEKRQIIVIDDGSRDCTAQIVEQHINNGDWPGVQLVSQKNAGKAHALNNALRNYVTGELVMCLDADSTIAPDALIKATSYFRDPSVVALSANVRVRTDGSFLSIIQYYEYIIGWQIKRAISAFNIDYIVGGVGSTFRRRALRAVGYYDTDTVVEDMDLTVKLIRLGHKEHRIIFGADVICYTASVLSFAGLLKQRYRWKYGHLQTLLKHGDLFFSLDKRYAKQLTWVYLPFVLFSETLVLMEPILPGLMLFLLYRYGDILSLFSGIAVVTGSTVLHIAGERSIPVRERLQLILAAPAMCFASYVFTAVWYISILRTYANIGSISCAKSSKWEPVERGKMAQLT